MELIFEELDFQTTPLGNISLRKRTDPRLGGKLLYEVKLNDEFLMSSLFTESEIQLSKLALSALKQAGHEQNINIVVGGLGLGYTAVAALEDNAVTSLRVIDVMAPVIKWHKLGLLPLGKQLSHDSRCLLVHGDFFKIATSESQGFDDTDKQVHGVLLDIDHSPTHWLNEENGSFYSKKGLQTLSHKIISGGVFAFWSNDPPDNNFVSLLNTVFKKCETHVISFPNLYEDRESSNTIYLAFNP